MSSFYHSPSDFAGDAAPLGLLISNYSYRYFYHSPSDYAGDAAPLGLLICSMISPKGALSLAQGIALGFNVANTFKAPTGRYPLSFFNPKHNVHHIHHHYFL
jgi:hypothetical protein